MRFFSTIRTAMFAVGVMMSFMTSSEVFATAPIVVSPYNNEVLTITGASIYPTITGTADSGSSITVEKDGSPICTTTTNTSGVWSCLSTVPFTPGTYALTATSILGDIREVSQSISCVIIEHTIDTPVVVSPYNNEVLTITGTSIFPTITGTASPDTSIVVKKDGSPVCTTTTNSSGIWSCLSTVPFTPGTYALTVTSTLGSQTKDSATISCVIILYTPPPTPCSPPTLNILSDVTLSCNSKTISDIYLSGSGSAGASVTITTASGVVVASSIVDSNGSWWATSSYAFAAGTYTLTATATLGNVTVVGASRTFTVRAATNCAPSHTPPYIAPVSNITLACGTTTTVLNLSGTGTPGATVTVRNSSNIPLGSATVGSGGSWSLTPASPFPAGALTLSVSSELPGSPTLQGNSTTFSILAPTNCGGTHSTPTILPVSNITLACGTTATAISLSGTGTPGATVIVRNSSGASLMTALISPEGSWSGTTWSLLSAGSHALSVSSTLGASTIGGNTTTFSILSPIDCGGGILHRTPVIAPVANATLSCNAISRSVNFSGTGTVGATITLRNASGASIATTTVGTGGIWSVTPIAGFTAGNYSITVESLYVNAILIGNTISFTIAPSTDCISHVTPVISPISSVTLACGQTSLVMNFSGSGSSGATITLRNPSGAILGTTIVTANGRWSLTPVTSFAPGSTSITVESTLGLNTIIGNTISFTLSSATNCGGGGGGSNIGPGGASPTVIIGGTTLTSTPLYVTPTLPPIRVIIPPQRPLTRYEYAHNLNRKSLNVRPYWQRFPEMKTPTKTFLGTGPKSLTERTSIVTSKRVQTNDDIQTKKAQAKKTFPYPLLGN